MRLRETPSSSIVCNGHLAVLLMPISAYAGQAMPQWPPAPQAIMFGFTRWKGLIGSAHVPDWTCFTLVSLHRIKDSPSLLGTIIRTRRNTHACTGAWTCTVRRLYFNSALLFTHMNVHMQKNKYTCTQSAHTETEMHSDRNSGLLFSMSMHVVCI